MNHINKWFEERKELFGEIETPRRLRELIIGMSLGIVAAALCTIGIMVVLHLVKQGINF